MSPARPTFWPSLTMSPLLTRDAVGLEVNIEGVFVRCLLHIDVVGVLRRAGRRYFADGHHLSRRRRVQLLPVGRRSLDRQVPAELGETVV